MRLTKSVFHAIGLWFFAWTPYATVALIGVLGYESYLTPGVSFLPAVFCKIAASIDPFVYALCQSRFKVEYIVVFLRSVIINHVLFFRENSAKDFSVLKRRTK